MEFIALNGEYGELLIGNLDPGGVSVFVELGFDVQPFPCRRAADQLDDNPATYHGHPFQFALIWQNIRGLILFHLLVPAGSWET